MIEEVANYLKNHNSLIPKKQQRLTVIAVFLYFSCL